MYHERQRLQKCLQHTLNNLLQQEAFTAEKLDLLADSLGGHAQRNWLFFSGNWDVNTLMAGLEAFQLDIRWHDARDTQLDRLDLDSHELFGIILNTPGQGWLSWVLQHRHWLAIRKLGGTWWNLDSKLPAPLSFAGCGGGDGSAELRDFLGRSVRDGAHLMLVNKAPRGSVGVESGAQGAGAGSEAGNTAAGDAAAADGAAVALQHPSTGTAAGELSSANKGAAQQLCTEAVG